MADVVILQRPRVNHGTAHGTVAPLDEYDWGTCDWGRCDNEAVAVRYDAHLREWLPVCAICRDLDEPRP